MQVAIIKRQVLQCAYPPESQPEVLPFSSPNQLMLLKCGCKHKSSRWLVDDRVILVLWTLTRPSLAKKAWQVYGKVNSVFDRNCLIAIIILPLLITGTLPNVSRNAIVNVAEIVCYDVFKEYILTSQLMRDGVPCHFTAAVMAGFCTTVVASPVDVVKTRFMNSSGQYRGAIDCAVQMLVKEGPTAFYKGFIPSFSRLVSWNICMWITYEQFKRLVLVAYNQPPPLNRL